MRTDSDARTTRVALWPPAGGGRCRLELAAGLVCPRVVRHDATGAQVVLVATTATLLGGDELRLDVEVGPGLTLDLRDAAATVAYHGRGRGAAVTASLRVHAGARLVWAGQPLVVCGGARVTRTVAVDVHEGGRLVARDQVALGRERETAGILRSSTTMTYAGRPALVEDLVLGAGSGPGAVGSARVLDSVTALGWRPAAEPAGRTHFSLHEPGAVARELVSQAHESGLDATWDAWRRL